MTTRSTWIEAWEGDLVPSAAARRSAARTRSRVDEGDRREAGVRSRAARYYGREATARLPQPAPEIERAQPLPKPRLVRRRVPQWRAFAAVVAFAAVLLGAAIVSPMLLSAGAAHVESQVGKIENQRTQVSATIAALSSQISALSAPDRVAEQAARLGLQPADKVHFVQAGVPGTGGETTVAGR